MKFQSPLIQGTLIKRYKRFMADVELKDGTIITAYCANSGALLGVTTPGLKVWLSKSPNPDRKLQYSWEMVEDEGVMIGVNTSHPNKIIKEALAQKQIDKLKKYANLKPEVKYGKNSRIDFLLTDDKLPPCYVEVKNVHLKRDSILQFPDCVTERGAKHLNELIEVVKNGSRAVMIYCCQRNDADAFTTAKDLDPTYAANFKKAMENGVEAIAYTCDMTTDGITLAREIPIQL